MSVRIREGEGRLILEFPLLPRVRTPLAWLAAAVAWPALAFEIAALRGLDGGTAMSLAVFPAIGVMVVGIRPLVRELSRRPVILTRTPTGIAVGAAGPFASTAFTVALTERRRRAGRTAFVVSFTATAPVRKAVVEMQILNHEFRTLEEASVIASTLAHFVGTAVRSASSA